MLACDRVDRRILAVRGWVFGEQVALREKEVTVRIQWHLGVCIGRHKKRVGYSKNTLVFSS